MSDKAMEALRMRLAKGEIGVDEFTKLEERLSAPAPDQGPWLKRYPVFRVLVAVLLLGVGSILMVALTTVPQWNVVSMLLGASLASASFWGAYRIGFGKSASPDGRDMDAT